MISFYGFVCVNLFLVFFGALPSPAPHQRFVFRYVVVYLLQTAFKTAGKICSYFVKPLLTTSQKDISALSSALSDMTFIDRRGTLFLTDAMTSPAHSISQISAPNERKYSLSSRDAINLSPDATITSGSLFWSAPCTFSMRALSAVK